MSNLQEQEKLNSIRNEMTHLWGTTCATFGGSIILLLTSQANMLCYMTAITGLLISIIMGNAYFVRRNETIKILKNLEDR